MVFYYSNPNGLRQAPENLDSPLHGYTSVGKTPFLYWPNRTSVDVTFENHEKIK